MFNNFLHVSVKHSTAVRVIPAVFLFAFYRVIEQNVCMTKYEINADDGKILPDTPERRVELAVYHENDIANTARNKEEWFHPPAVAEYEVELENVIAYIDEIGGVFISPEEETASIAKVNAIYMATGNKKALELLKYLEEKKRQAPE